jgi:hypothetical protein
MPFCRKCGRRLLPYSESCPDCLTSTTGPVINLKKLTAAKSFKIAASSKIVKAGVPRNDSIISIQVIDPIKSTKVDAPVKVINTINFHTQIIPSRSATPAVVPPAHEIKKSKISLKKDIISNPHDYETQAFGFVLQCRNDHFWSGRKALPISNGKAFCPKCGEPLKKLKPKQKRRPAGFNY